MKDYNRHSSFLFSFSFNSHPLSCSEFLGNGIKAHNTHNKIGTLYKIIIIEIPTVSQNGFNQKEKKKKKKDL